MAPKPPAAATGYASTTRLEPLSTSLYAATTAASTRAEEATLLFGNIASLLDEQLQGQSAKSLPSHLRKDFITFCQDISIVARRHFDSHVRGISRPPTPYGNSVLPGTPQTSSPSSEGSRTPPTEESPADESLPGRKTARAPEPAQKRSATYANITAKPLTVNLQAKQRPKSKTPQKTSSPDNRLFVRLPENHVLRAVSTYSIQNDLNQALGKKLVKEVQTTRTGLALCPASSAPEDSLEASIPQITTLFHEKGPCIVEKATNLVSFRIASVPRSFQGYVDNQVTRIQVTPELFASVLTEELGIAPAQVAETRNSIEAAHTFSSTWIARFPDGTTTLPQAPLLFGARASVKLLPKKLAVIQCLRCFMWHNERTCARAARCRLCGSTSHAENEHAPCSTTAHSCPPRCFHCHGPHPADSIECLLRPKSNQIPLTKQQKSQIRQACSAAYLRVKATSCGMKAAMETSPKPSMEVDAPSPTPSAPPRPRTPPASLAPVIPPATNQGSRYSALSPSEQRVPGKRLFSRSSLNE